MGYIFDECYCLNFTICFEDIFVYFFRKMFAYNLPAEVSKKMRMKHFKKNNLGLRPN